MGLFDESHGSVDEASAEVADAVATTIDKAKKSSAEALGTSKKLKAPKTPSKAMVAMKK